MLTICASQLANFILINDTFFCNCYSLGDILFHSFLSSNNNVIKWEKKQRMGLLIKQMLQHISTSVNSLYNVRIDIIFSNPITMHTGHVNIKESLTIIIVRKLSLLASTCIYMDMTYTSRYWAELWLYVTYQ